MATADELAATAALVMGESAEGRPVVVLRGASYEPGEGGIAELLRQRAADMFR